MGFFWGFATKAPIFRHASDFFLFNCKNIASRAKTVEEIGTILSCQQLGYGDELLKHFTNSGHDEVENGFRKGALTSVAYLKSADDLCDPPILSAFCPYSVKKIGRNVVKFGHELEVCTVYLVQDAKSLLTTGAPVEGSTLTYARFTKKRLYSFRPTERQGPPCKKGACIERSFRIRQSFAERSKKEEMEPKRSSGLHCKTNPKQWNVEQRSAQSDVE